MLVEELTGRHGVPSLPVRSDGVPGEALAVVLDIRRALSKTLGAFLHIRFIS